MTDLRDIYKCELCGHVVEIINEGEPLVCCGKPMVKLEAKSKDEGQEKHVPVVEENDCGITVKVGSIEHPMEEKHYIKFIEVLTEGQVLRVELKPGQKPEAEFCCVKPNDILEVREYCTVHNLWKT